MIFEKNAKKFEKYSVDRLNFFKRYAILILGMSIFALFLLKNSCTIVQKRQKNFWRNS